ALGHDVGHPRGAVLARATELSEPLSVACVELLRLDHRRERGGDHRPRGGRQVLVPGGLVGAAQAAHDAALAVASSASNGVTEKSPPSEPMLNPLSPATAALSASTASLSTSSLTRTKRARSRSLRAAITCSAPRTVTLAGRFRQETSPAAKR